MTNREADGMRRGKKKHRGKTAMKFFCQTSLKLNVNEKKKKTVTKSI